MSSRLRPARVAAVLLSMVALVVSTGLQQAGPDGAGAAGAVGAVPASRQAEKIHVLPLRGPIDKFSMFGLKQRLERAADEGATAVVIEIDTPGGEVGAVLEISDLIKKSAPPNTVAWINNEAFSGGAIVALACPGIVTSDPAKLGDALPVQVAPVVGLIPLPQEERQKILAPLLVDLIDSARRNGYDEKLVQGFVSLGVELWLIERTTPGPQGEPVGELLFIDLAEYEFLFGEPPMVRTPAIPSARTAADAEAGGGDAAVSEAIGTQATDGPSGVQGAPGPDDPTRFQPAAPGLEGLDDRGNLSLGLEVATRRPVLSEADRGGWRVVEYVADGRAPVTMTADQLVRFGLATQVIETDEELKAYFGASELVRWEESAWMALARFMASIYVRAILLVVAVVAFFIEMASPGLGVPAVVGVVAIALFMAPPAMVGMAGWWEFAAMGLGLVLLLVEIFLIPGVGVVGVIGAGLMFVGLVGTFTGGGRFTSTAEILAGLAAVTLSLATAGVVLFFVLRNFSSIPVFNRLVLANAPAEEPSGMLGAMATPAAVGPAVGDEGVVISELRPSGRARFGDDVVDVVSVGPIVPPNARVRVLESDAFRVVVEPLGGVERA
ncbi:MAG: NfeD family protein [Planctomycetota bacterium]